MDRDFQIWQLEERLLVQRLTIYLLTSSILFLGFVNVKNLWLGILVAFMGLISCVFAWWHFRGIPARLEQLESRLGLSERSSGKRCRGRHLASKGFPVFFGIIWTGALISSILSVFRPWC